MKVNNPHLRGKIFVKYDGSNVPLLQQQIKLHQTRLFNHYIIGVEEPLLVNFKLHNNIEVAISLNSMTVYVYDKGWRRDDDSICNVTNILVYDNEIFIKGVLSYCNYIDENNIYIEPYHFDLIFGTVYAVLLRLEEHKVSYTDFRIMNN